MRELTRPILTGLDAKPKFLLWDFDLVAIVAVFIFMGGLLHQWAIGALMGFFLSYRWSSVLKTSGQAFALHLLAWHCPWRIFKRTPASYRRYFIG